MKKTERPVKCTEEMLDYLDALRASGVTNMFGGGVYLREEYPGLSKEESHKVLAYWMETFPREKAA